MFLAVLSTFSLLNFSKLSLKRVSNNLLFTAVNIKLNKLEMFVNEIHICVCTWEDEGTKNSLWPRLSLELVKVGGLIVPIHLITPEIFTSF